MRSSSCVAEKSDFQGAFALGVAQVDLGAEAFAELVFEAGHVRVRGGGVSGPALMPVALSRLWSLRDQASVWRTFRPSLRTRSAAELLLLFGCQARG